MDVGCFFACGVRELRSGKAYCPVEYSEENSWRNLFQLIRLIW